MSRAYNEKNPLERGAVERESRLFEEVRNCSGILSSAEHEEFCVKLPGPSGKAKYFRETDSELVP